VRGTKKARFCCATTTPARFFLAADASSIDNIDNARDKFTAVKFDSPLYPSMYLPMCEVDHSDSYNVRLRFTGVPSILLS
jgi:hypothetical protein